MDASDPLFRYFKQKEDGTFDLPPLVEPDPDMIQLMGQHLRHVEQEERLGLSKSESILFVG